MDIVSFDLEMLNFGCAASMGPVVTFLSLGGRMEGRNQDLPTEWRKHRNFKQ
jgi:hypothetical protein